MSFLTQRAQRIHREHKDWILRLLFQRNIKETMILIKLKVSRGLRRLHRFLTQRAQSFFTENTKIAFYVYRSVGI